MYILSQKKPIHLTFGDNFTVYM